MGTPFSDITLYLPTGFETGPAESRDEQSFQNYVSDLYVQKMHGYKPPGVTRITIQPAFHKIWNRTWKNGSIVAIAPYFNSHEYLQLNKSERYRYLLDLIQVSTLDLSKEYHWDVSVFENAYKEVLDSNFKFSVSYPSKLSRDKKTKANLYVEKSETVTSVFIHLVKQDTTEIIKLFEKENKWWYDCIYYLSRYTKWYDRDKFGIAYGKGKIDIWYSMSLNTVELFENGIKVDSINFREYFLFG